MSKLAESTLRFVTRLNDRDLEGIVSSFSEAGCYTDPQGAFHCGAEALRLAFTPLSDGLFGSVRCHVDESLLDEDQEKALVTWSMEMTSADGSTSRIGGLDIIGFAHNEVISKNCFCKATGLLVETS